MTEKNVSTQSDSVAKMSGDWPMIEALLGGTRAMRVAGKTFLPKWPSESDDAYKVRLSTSVLHPVFKRTVGIMSARPFVQDLKIDPTIPAKINYLAEDCDKQRTGLDEFFADRFTQAMAYGLTGVLVDHTGNGGKTLREEKETGARVYFCTYPAESILGWKLRDGKLMQLRLMENIAIDDGEFGETTVQQVRVLTPGAWATYRKSKDKKDEWVMHESGITTIDFVPFVFLYGLKLGFGVGTSPLLDLAYQNVEHWQSCSDQQNILHVARVPILFAKGFGDSNFTIGADNAISAESEKADVKWVEHTGAAVDAGKEAILALEDRMQQAGAELLIKRAGQTTATQILSENEANKSLLENIVEEFEDGIELCLEFASKWVGETYAPEVELFKDFSIDATSDDMDYILRAKDSDILTAEQVVQELQRRGMVQSDKPKNKRSEMPVA